jgi:dTDP-4-dehydrorhamnose 3,5-epimerase
MNQFEEFHDFPGVWSRSAVIHEDSRGYFYEELRRDDLPESIPNFVQDSTSFSRAKVLRGMHLQLEQWQLVTLVEGEIIDVLLNVNPNSANFQQPMSLKLSWNEMNQLLISPGIAHGFAVLNGHARIHYKSSVYYGSTNQYGIHWNSKEISNLWPKETWTISARDSEFLPFSTLDSSYV